MSDHLYAYCILAVHDDYCCAVDSNIQFDTPIGAALLAAQRAERVQNEKVTN